MTSVPLNLTVIREDFQVPARLSELKARMLAPNTDYIMVAGLEDIVEVTSPLTAQVHYLPTHMATRRAFRYSRPVVPYDPLLLTQFNILGRPILHKSLVPLFPETSVEPWHRVMVRAQMDGASFALAEGNHTIIDPWPRPALSGAYAHYRHSLDPEAVMEAVPGVVVEEINRQPFYSLRQPRHEAITVFHRNCSDDFLGSIAGLNVNFERLESFDYTRIRDSNTNYTAWFDGIAAAIANATLHRLLVALEFPGVTVASPRVISQSDLASYHHAPFSTLRGISTGFNPNAWMTQTRTMPFTPFSDGHVNNQAILREIS